MIAGSPYKLMLGRRGTSMTRRRDNRQVSESANWEVLVLLKKKKNTDVQISNYVFGHRCKKATCYRH